jgi:molybdate/tungstate transport system substrate-binding protein
MQLTGTSARLAFLVAALLAAGCGGDSSGSKGPSAGPGAGKPVPRAERKLRVFHAAGLAALLEAVRADCRRELGVVLETEGSGSQVACRKITELKRDCDLVMLADSFLVGELLAGSCSWRLDFATDEIVLGVGVRAPNTSDAEKDWPPALMAQGVRIGRVDENLAPIGYRTLLTWKLQEMRGPTGLYDRLLKKCDRVVDDVGRLTPLLKVGELDYAFVYRSSCIGHDIRFVRLDDAINLGSASADYSKASVTFQKLNAGQKESVTIAGGPVVWTLSIPERGADAASAAEFVNWLLKRKADALDKNGLRPIRPALFFGPAEQAAPFKDAVKHAGKLE